MQVVYLEPMTMYVFLNTPNYSTDRITSFKNKKLLLDAKD